jgi:hypothetical protein
MKTGNALITKSTSLIGALTVVSAYIYMKPVWLVSSVLFFARSILHKRDIKKIREKFELLDLNRGGRIYPTMPYFVRYICIFYCMMTFLLISLAGLNSVLD